MSVALALSDANPCVSREEKPLLVVRHGRGRGRLSTFFPMFLRWIRDAEPRLRELLLLHRTGEKPPSLDGIGAVLFFLADPLDCYPECAAEAKEIAASARSRGIPILNAPEGLNNTSKARQSAIWRKAGLPCARAWAAPDAPMLRKLLPRLSFPLILRFDQGHTQQGLFFCRTMEEAERRLPAIRYPAAVLEYVDTRSSWRQHDPDSIMASHFHKKRSMIFPGSVFNNHIFFSGVPIVGSRTCTFAAAAKGNHHPRIEEMIRADIDYSLSPPEQPELMRAAVRALGLDVAAVDYASLPDGRIILWEANPYFDLPPESQALLPVQRRLADRNPRYVASFAQDLGRLTGYVDA